MSSPPSLFCNVFEGRPMSRRTLRNTCSYLQPPQILSHRKPQVRGNPAYNNFAYNHPPTGVGAEASVRPATRT